MLGIKIVGGRLYLSPNLPHTLKGYTARIKMGDRELDVTVKNENGYHIKVNGKEYDKKGYSLKNEMIGV